MEKKISKPILINDKTHNINQSDITTVATVIDSNQNQTLRFTNYFDQKSEESLYLDKSFFAQNPKSTNRFIQPSLEFLYPRQYNDSQFKHNKQNYGLDIIEQNVEWIQLRVLNNYNKLYNKRKIPSAKNLNIAFQSIKNSLFYLQNLQLVLFQQLSKYSADIKGAYIYQLMQKGLVNIITIDQYVPTLNGKVLFSEPDKSQFFHCLIQKALAKLYKGYNKISKYPSQIIQNLSHFVRQQIDICRNYSQQFYRDIIQKNLQMKNIILFRTNGNKVLKQNYGLLCNQQYVIKSICKNNEDQIILQIIQPINSKWNGKYNTLSKTQNMSQIKSIDQSYTYMKLLHMLCISDQLCILHNNQNFMKNWGQYYYDLNSSIYYDIEIQQTNQIIIYLYLEKRYTRTTLVLAQKINSTYKYISASMNQFSCTNFLRVKLQKGNYVLYLKIQQQNQNIILHHSYSLTYLYKNTLKFIKTLKNQHPNFLSLMFSYYAHLQNPSALNIIRNQPLQYISLKMLYKQTGYAYINIYVGQGSPYKIHVEIDLKQFRNSGFFIKKPYDKNQYLKIQINQNENILLLFKIRIQSKKVKVLFPPPYLKIYEFL